ncbi:MAG: thioredoxin family protein [Chitinophagales bacterium]|nr:thioredoxin family protein [Chitinophagales bacterium]
MKKLKLFPLFFIGMLFSVSASNSIENKDDNTNNWTSIDKALAQTSAQKQFIFVEIYTDWCGWCKKLEDYTFTDENVEKTLNDNFVKVKLNAESEQKISFKGKEYDLVQNGNRTVNQLALDLGSMNGRLGYPTIVVLDKEGNKLKTFPGYKDAQGMQVLLSYFTSGAYKTTDFQIYQAGQ